MNVEEIKQKMGNMGNHFKHQGDAWDWMAGEAIPFLLGEIEILKAKEK
jgi:hypothetical protein